MQPARVIDGSTQPGEPFWHFVDALQSQSGETEVEFFGPISEYSWFGDEITPKTFRDQLLSKGKGGPVTVKVNSPGGEVFAAAAIRSILQDYPGRVTADIIGIAASAATVVVTGANVVRMRDAAMFMIHDPATIAAGTIEEMRQVVEVLSQVKETIINSYQAKTGLSREKLAQMMKDETWMTAQQAKDFGFVDEVVSGATSKGVAKNFRAGFVNCLANFANVPEGLVESLSAVRGPLSGAEEEAESEELVNPDAGAASTAAVSDNERVPGVVLGLEAQRLRERVNLILRGEA